MGAGGQSTYSRMLTSDATRIASYLNQLGEVTRLTSDAQQASYQAQALRANKAIYETEYQLAESSLQDQTYYGVEELKVKSQQAEVDTQGNILTNIAQQRLAETKGANQLKETELSREYDLLQKEQAGFYNTQQRLSELAISAVQTTSNLKEKLYNIRRGVESSVGKVTASFAERGVTSRNAQAIIMSDLNDRAYRAEIASDETIALLGLNSTLSDLSVMEYKDAMRLGREEVDTKNALGRASYTLETQGQRGVLTQEIQNARNNLQLQLDLYNVNADSLVNSAEHKAQESYYDSIVKTYNDEVNARLKIHQSQVAEFMARQQLMAAKYGYASKTDASIIDIPVDT